MEALVENNSPLHIDESIDNYDLSLANPTDLELSLPTDPLELEASTGTLQPSNDIRSLVRRGSETFSAAAVEDFSLSRQDILAELTTFFTEAYQRYPIIHAEILIHKVESELYCTDRDFRTILIAVFLLNEVIQFRRSPDRGLARLDQLCKTLQRARAGPDGYDFAEFPTLDAVIVSLFLFVAYSVCERHNRAFTHLAEAIGLMELVEYPCDPVEIVIYHRLECLLFISEASSILVYGGIRKRRIARKPSNIPVAETSLFDFGSENTRLGEFSQTCFGLDFVDLDRQAMALLVALTHVYEAAGTTDVAKVAFHDNSISHAMADNDRSPTCLVQTADVAITRQLHLALHWWRILSNNSPRPRAKRSTSYSLQLIGLTALQWISFLKPEECRIVGHGKFALLAETMFNISTTIETIPSCCSLIGNLIRTVSKVDHERSFAPRLSLIEICTEEVPRSIVLDTGDPCGRTETESRTPLR